MSILFGNAEVWFVQHCLNRLSLLKWLVFVARDIEADYAVKIPMGIEISRIAPLNSESSSSSLRRMDLGFMCYALPVI